jgi:ribosomal protein S18 acetylase RimI-like enzyme
VIEFVIQMNVKIRSFRDEDFWQVENLVRQFMNDDPFSPPVIVRQIQDLFGDFLLVAYDPDNSNTEILGYVMGGIAFRDKQIGWILEIYVREEFRSRGIGYDLLHALILKLQKAGAKEIMLTVDIKNPSAMDIYKRNGFLIDKCINEHYRKGKKVYLMRKKL